VLLHDCAYQNGKHKAPKPFTMVSKFGSITIPAVLHNQKYARSALRMKNTRLQYGAIGGTMKVTITQPGAERKSISTTLD
jgi:hypothetical protein